MKCIVTGGAGFIGSNLVDRLIDDGHEVIVIDDLSTGKKENINPKANFENKDIGISYSIPYMKNIMKDVDVVFHMACLARVQLSIEEPLLYHNKNVDGIVNILEVCREVGVKRLVFSSSSSVYGDAEEVPTTEDGWLKIYDEDFDKAIEGAARVCEGMDLPDRKFGVFIEMTFQLGATGLSKFKKALAAAKDHDWQECHNQMLDSRWYKQTPNRAKQLAEIMLED